MTGDAARESTLRGWRGYWRFVTLGARASRGLTLLSVVAVAAAAAVPLAAAVAIGAVVGRVDDVAESGLDSPAGRTTVVLVIVAGVLFFLQRALAALQSAATTALGERVDALLQRELMDAVMTPRGIGHLEDPTTANLIEVGRDTFRTGWARPGRIAGTAAGVLSGRIIFLGAAAIFAAFNPVLAAVFAAAGLWAAREDRLASHAAAAHHGGGTEIARRTSYFHTLGVTPAPAKEVRIFGLADFLHERYMTWWHRSMVEVFAPGGPRPMIATAAFGAAVLGMVALVARAAIDGRVEPGDVAVYAQALMIGVGGIQTASSASVQTELGLATLERYTQAVDAARAVDDAVTAGTTSAEGFPSVEIRFEQVSFAYPGSDRNVLDGLNLVIPAGGSVAIVGMNGAGKTTLIKLLCQLYQPQEGRITVDGVDLVDIDPVFWRQRLAAVFQDSMRFELSAQANVSFGRVTFRDDTAGVHTAAARAGVADAIEVLPRAWESPLSPAFAGGADLSGGEWQKLGLARALFAIDHGAGVLILDEPAAHLDARAEARLYQEFLSMTAGITTVVISHRFSTVRQATSIVVLADGRVAEQGSHDELIRRRGMYAEMFNLQAARFNEPLPTNDGAAPA